MFPWDSWFLHYLLPKEEISSQSLFCSTMSHVQLTECQGDCKKLRFKEHIDVQAGRAVWDVSKREKKKPFGSPLSCRWSYSYCTFFRFFQK